MVCATFLIAAVFFIFTINDSSEGIDQGSLTGFTAILGLVALGVCLTLAVRGWKAAIYVDNKGITIVNLFRTHRFAWAEIDGFVIGLHRVVSFPTSVVRLRSGREIRVPSISPPNPGTRPNNREAQNIVAALNRELEAAKER